MNMIHACDSNKFTQQKRGAYYIIETVLSYIKLFLGIILLLLLCITGLSRKLVKIGTLRTPPGYGPAEAI